MSARERDLERRLERAIAILEGVRDGLMHAGIVGGAIWIIDREMPALRAALSKAGEAAEKEPA